MLVEGGAHRRGKCCRFVRCARDMAPRRLIQMGRFGVNAARASAPREDVEGAAGGDGQARTADPLLAKQVLSQLSYIPEGPDVGLSGFEPETSRLSAVRSHQLS